MVKRILCLDFDGVVHSYVSGWQGARVIPDPPVKGALEFIASALDEFEVCILSSRSHHFGGRGAMRRWLIDEYRKLAETFESTPTWLVDHLYSSADDDWNGLVAAGTANLVFRIGFPKHKPPAFVTIDDRALTFTGEWPAIVDLRDFEPWHRRKS